MEAVTQIFFKEQINVPGESRSPRLQKGKEVFGEFVQKECEQVTGEKQNLPEGLTASLSKELEAMIEALGGLSAEEGKALTEQLMDRIKELVSSGQEEEVLSFLQGLLQVETQQGFAECVESFLALDTVSEWGAEALDTNWIFTGLSGEEAQGVPGSAEGETVLPAFAAEEETVSPAFAAEGETVSQVFARPEQKASDPALTREAVTRAFSMPEEKSRAMDAVGSNQGQTQETNTDDVVSRLSARTIEQVRSFLSRRQEVMTEQARNDIRPLMENTIFIKNIEVGQPEGIPSLEEQIAPEQLMETKLSLLQDIRQLVEKAEFRQGVKEWQARLELKPEQLGNTLMRLEMSEEKTVLDITVARPEAQELVENSLRELQQIFADKGISIEEINVEVDPQMQFSQQSFARTGSEQHSDSNSRAAAGTDAGFDYWDGQEIYSPEHLFVEREGVNCFA